MTAIFISVIGLALMVSAVLVIFNQSRFMPLLVVAVVAVEEVILSFWFNLLYLPIFIGKFHRGKGV